MCNFCNYDDYNKADKIFDKANYPTNNIYLTCEFNFLRLWKHSSYIGCYKIKYCPICGRKLEE